MQRALTDSEHECAGGQISICNKSGSLTYFNPDLGLEVTKTLAAIKMKWRSATKLTCSGNVFKDREFLRVQLSWERLTWMPRGMNTAYNIINLFSTASTDTSVIAFLDLENAFWLESPLAIPETKIQRGIRGSSFAWIVIISGTEVPEPGLTGTSRSTYH